MKKYLFLALLTLLPLTSYAAGFNGILLSTNPENPAPGSRVQITASVLGGTNYANDLVWTVDGMTATEGVGTNALTITTPTLGNAVEVIATAVDAGTIVASGTLVIRPSEVTIEWEGDGATIPFSHVRPLLTGHGSIKAQAIATLITSRGTRVADKDVLYVWKVNGKIVSGSSGYGRNTLSAAPTFFNDRFFVSVSAQSRDTSLKAESSVVIFPHPAQVVVYETSPLGGLLDTNAITGVYPFEHDEVSFMAFPLNTSNDEQHDLAWSINKEPVQTDSGDSRRVVFKKTAAGHGQYTVGVTYSSTNNFLDRAVQSFLLNF
jgi:hypothetical protein